MTATVHLPLSVFRIALAATALTTMSCSQQRSSAADHPNDQGVTGAAPSMAEAVPLFGNGLSPEEKRVVEEREQAARKARWAERKKTYKDEGASQLWTTATKEAAAQNHKDAANAFTAFAVHHADDPRFPLAVKRGMAGRFAIQEFAQGLSLVEDAIAHAPSDTIKARLLRMLGNAYFAIPHWGVTRGGEFIRAQHGQGKSTQSYFEDRTRAIAKLEQARDIMEAIAPEVVPPSEDDVEKTPGQSSQKPGPPSSPIDPDDLDPAKTATRPLTAEERVETQFELIGALARFTPYDGEWNYWWYGWAASQSDGLEEEEGEDEKVGRHGRYGHSWHSQLYAAQPKGLPVTKSGELVFAPRLAAYDKTAEDTAKMKFLLEEIRSQSGLNTVDAPARSLLMQAILFASRDGVNRLDRLRNHWVAGAHPFKSDIESTNLYELEDDEVFGLVATHLQRFRLPPDESLPALVRRLEREHPKSKVTDEALYQLGQFFQARQQYDKARAVYRRVLKERPSSNFASTCRHALTQLDQREIGVRWSGTQPAGQDAKVNLRFRNLTDVELRFRPVAQEQILSDFKKAYANGKEFKRRNILQPTYLGYALVENRNNEIGRYAPKVTHTVTRKVVPNSEGRYVDTQVSSGIDAAGLYVVEAYEKGKKERLGRGLIVLEKIAVVQKRDRKGAFNWVVDANTGRPIANAKVERFEYWQTYNNRTSTSHSKLSNHRSGLNGIARMKHTNYQTLTTVRAEGSVTFSGWSYYYGNYSPNTSRENETVALVMTDRPVYRPGDTVRMKVWARKKQRGQYLDETATKRVQLQVRGPGGETVEDKSLTLSALGATTFDVALKGDAALGAYSIRPIVDGNYPRIESATFRVEEYKAPEFTVAVKAAGQARLGETIEAEVQADYLFGGGVAGGTVRYKVFRQDHDHTMIAPGPWDWLYGAGYGHPYYAYAWFDWWEGAGPRPWIWYPWWGPKPEPIMELVKEGEGKLDDKGRLKIKIDTKGAKESFGKSDHQFTVKADVVDLSRRLIRGEGSVVVTRNAFFASIQNEAGYWRANETARLSVMTQKPDGSPLAVDGKVEVQRISYVGQSATETKYDAVETIPVKTDVHGVTRVSFLPKTTGQYRFTFVAKDAWGGEVRKSTLAWVVGPEWHGRQFRFNGLELLADKRVYKVGDVAKLLVNTNQPGASVLLATRVDQGTLLDYRVVKMNGKSMVVEVPVGADRVPNFFVEATTVAGGTLFQELRELFVPPQNAELRVEVQSDRESYGPGDEVELRVKTTTLNGDPAPADVALSVFDTSVLYIQPETTPDPRKLFWAAKRSHSIQSQSSLTRAMSWNDRLSAPDRQAYWTLRSASSRYFQREISWAYRNNLSQLKGGEAVAQFAAKDTFRTADKEVPANKQERRREARKKKKAKPASSARGLGSRGTGMGGGGAEEKSAVGGDGLGRSSALKADAAPAAEPMEDSIVELNESSDRDGDANPKKAKSVRRKFADTAHFAPTVQTDEKGEARVRFKLPDNLTTWRVKAVGLGEGTRAGQSTSTLLTTKKLLVRLQAPRFFRERDRVALSAVVHNGFDTKQKVQVSIDVTEDLLTLEGKQAMTVTVPPGADKRIDFWATVKGEGTATVRMDAVASTESDAKELTFPVLVHGMTKTVSKVGSIASDAPGEKSIVLDIPADRRKDLSRLEIRYSPTLAGGMLDALPYLLDYPYGCTEQTLSRFVPAVLTRRALQQAGGLNLEALGQPGKRNLNPQQLTKSGNVDTKRLEREHRLMKRSPVFDTAELNAIIAAGLKRLSKMQNGDGGWGWWGRDGSSRYTTAHVVAGLLDAQDADLAFDRSMLQRGQSALTRLVSQSIWRYKRDNWVGNEDAYAAWVMSRYGQKNTELNKYLWERRDRLSPYGKILAAMAFHAVDDKTKATTFLKNAEQILKRDDENETSWLETNRTGWWYWYNDAIETNAIYLRALDTMRPKSKDAPRVVKWLLNHRKNGYYWRSTRDTASVVAAFANHMQKSGERKPDYDLDILLDGKVMKTVHIDSKNLFTFDNAFVLEGDALTSGKHTVTFRRRGKGAVYFNSYLSYFTTEEDVTKTGLEIKVDRTYFKLVRQDRIRKVQGDRGQPLELKEVAYAKVPFKSGAQLESGDLVLVELMLESKNDYTFLAFEDPKPAGMEAVALRSGQTYGEAVANMELRDEKVVFFLRSLTRGKLKLSYRLRAEIPGEFHAMPTFGFGMYAPELKTNSDEMRVKIVDAPQ